MLQGQRFSVNSAKPSDSRICSHTVSALNCAGRSLHFGEANRRGRNCTIVAAAAAPVLTGGMADLIKDYGSSSNQGLREGMEDDMHTLVDDKHMYCAVFDG